MWTKKNARGFVYLTIMKLSSKHVDVLIHHAITALLPFLYTPGRHLHCSLRQCHCSLQAVIHQQQALLRHAIPCTSQPLLRRAIECTSHPLLTLIAGVDRSFTSSHGATSGGLLGVGAQHPTKGQVKGFVQAFDFGGANARTPCQLLGVGAQDSPNTTKCARCGTRNVCMETMPFKVRRQGVEQSESYIRTL